jgi:hypothetical protein
LIGRIVFALVFLFSGSTVHLLQTGGLGAPGDIVWDAYLAFGQNSRWRSEPGGLLASGSDIIDNTSGLEQHFIPLLARG